MEPTWGPVVSLNHSVVFFLVNTSIFEVFFCAGRIILRP